MQIRISTLLEMRFLIFVQKLECKNLTTFKIITNYELCRVLEKNYYLFYGFCRMEKNSYANFWVLGHLKLEKYRNQLSVQNSKRFKAQWASR